MVLWMLNCKDVSQRVSESMDRKLAVSQRVGIRIHLMMCRFCSRYKRQIFLLRKTLQLYATHPQIVQPLATLPQASRDRMKELLIDIQA
jgi:hypothetical protein